MNRILFICNAFEDITRIERKITTDSPACSNKIFSTCKSFEKSSTRVTVLSLGRGRVDKSSNSVLNFFIADISGHKDILTKVSFYLESF